MRELYAMLRRTAYSVALGPPRKILADVEAAGRDSVFSGGSQLQTEI